MRITIKDIAKKANVSITTVSRVLNNKQDGIGAATRKRVLDIIKELDYYPNSTARSMVTKKTKTIGLIIPDIRNPFFPELVRGVEDVANELEYSLFLCNTDGSFKREEESLRLMKEQNVEGLIFTGSFDSEEYLLQELVEKYKLPIVLLDRGLNNEKFSGVYIDNEKGGYIATRHLINLDHTRIACITGPDNIQNSKARLNGYFKALKQFDIQIDEKIIISGDYQMDGGYQAAKVLFENNNITAIFVLNDLMAFGVYQAALEIGIRIPEDISIVGFDNLKYTQLLTPKLTTIEQPTYKMGSVAANILIKQLEATDKDRSEAISLEPKLIVGESSKKLMS